MSYDARSSGCQRVANSDPDRHRGAQSAVLCRTYDVSFGVEVGWSSPFLTDKYANTDDINFVGCVNVLEFASKFCFIRI